MEIIEMQQSGLANQQNKELVDMMQGMGVALAQVGEMLRVYNERMTAIERKLSALEKVTPAQATELSRLLKVRADELAEMYRARDCGREIAAAIRRAVKLETGVKTFKEISRCDYKIIKDMIAGWDEYEIIREIKRKARDRE